MKRKIEQIWWWGLIIISVVKLISCTDTVKEKTVEKSKKDTVINNVTEIKADTINTIRETSIMPYKEVDSLITEIEIRYNKTDIFKLDSICIKSDGDLTEKYYEITKRLFHNKLRDFIAYISEHPNTCLKTKLIEGISADMSVFEGDERFEQIKQEKERILTQAKREKLLPRQMKIIEAIYANVKPSLFD